MALFSDVCVARVNEKVIRFRQSLTIKETLITTFVLLFKEAEFFFVSCPTTMRGGEGPGHFENKK